MYGDERLRAAPVTAIKGVPRIRLARRRKSSMSPFSPRAVDLAKKTPGVFSPKGPKGAAQKRHLESFSPRARPAVPHPYCSFSRCREIWSHPSPGRLDRPSGGERGKGENLGKANGKQQKTMSKGERRIRDPELGTRKGKSDTEPAVAPAPPRLRRALAGGHLRFMSVDL